MLVPALPRSSSTRLTPSGSCCAYSWTSSFALRRRASLRNVVYIHPIAGENLIDLADSFPLMLGILVRQPLRIFGLVFRNILLKNFGKKVRKLFRIQFVGLIVLIELFIHEIF